MDFFNNAIKSSKLVIFSASDCRYCQDLENELSLLFKRTNNKHVDDRHTIKLDELEDRQEVANVLYGLSKIKTIPQVFIDGKFVGDSSRILYAINNNFFLELLGH